MLDAGKFILREQSFVDAAAFPSVRHLLIGEHQDQLRLFVVAVERATQLELDSVVDAVRPLPIECMYSRLLACSSVGLFAPREADSLS